MVHFSNTVLHCYYNAVLLRYSYSCIFVTIYAKFIVSSVYLLTARRQST